MTADAAQVRWARWWCEAWDWAHPDWKARFVGASGVSEQTFGSLMRSRHGAFLHATGVVPTQPPVLEQPCAQNLMQWLALSDEQQEQALFLARRICYAPTDRLAGGATLQPLLASVHPHEQWCRSLAKALRPGAWLDSHSTDARLLLGAWVGEDCWSRLRLSWAPGEVGETLGQLPGNKLHTLWHAIFWRVNTA
jgi:hypothetical protein